MSVPRPSDPGKSPVGLLRELQEAIGDDEVARWCADLMTGVARPDDPDLPPLAWFGSGAATLVQRGDLETSDQAYWVRVWAARSLLHGWSESAADVAVPAIVHALGDDAWRVREMAAKVVRRWRIDAAAKQITALLSDDVPRVRAAAKRAEAALSSTKPRPAARPTRSRLKSAPSKSGSSKSGSSKSGSATRRPRRRRRKAVRVEDLETAVGDAVRALRGAADSDWTVAAGTLSWDCRHTAAHIADDLVTYAFQLAAQAPSGYLPFRFGPSRGTSADGLLTLIEAAGTVLAATARTARADARGWHPHGVADAEGFLALGIAEVVVHTHDIAAGLKVAYEPDPHVCERAAARLLPDVQPDDESAFSLLLWASGRIELPRRERSKRWRWSASPDEPG